MYEGGGEEEEKGQEGMEARGIKEGKGTNAG